MPAKKKVNYKKLLEAVKSGKNQSEIMKEFKFNTSAQFKSHYLDALMEAGKAPKIKSSRTAKKNDTVKEAFVSKRGSIVISKGLVSAMGYAEGDRFAVRNTKSGISLRKIN
jgi:hypothetical protein